MQESKPAKYLYKLLFIIVLCLLVVIAVAAIVLIVPDYIANAKGEPETGWASAIGFIIFTPPIAVLVFIELFILGKLRSKK